MSDFVLEQVFVWHTTAMPYRIFPLMLREDLDGRLECKCYGRSYFDFNIKDNKHSGKPLLCPPFFYDTEVYSEGFLTTNFI